MLHTKYMKVSYRLRNTWVLACCSLLDNKIQRNSAWNLTSLTNKVRFVYAVCLYHLGNNKSKFYRMKLDMDVCEHLYRVHKLKYKTKSNIISYKDLFVRHCKICSFLPCYLNRSYFANAVFKPTVFFAMEINVYL